jgi:putative transposase
MGALVLVPPADPTVYGPPVLPIGAKIEIMGSEYKLIRFTGHQMVYERDDKLETLPLSWNQYVHLWNTVGLRVIPSQGHMTEAKTRLAGIPFDFFDPKTQKTILHKEYYCKAMHAALLDGSLRCRAKGDVEKWLAELERDLGYRTHPSRGTVMRDYKFWLGSDFRCGVLAHGNTMALRQSVFGDIVVDVIYDTLETYAAPNAEFSLENVQGEIAAEIGRRIADGELECDRVPALSTIANYRRKLNQYLVIQVQDGTYEADRKLQPKGKILIPDFPMARWEIDHTLLPIKVAFEAKDSLGNVHRMVVGKIWCTAVIDATTRFVLAIILGIDPPSSMRVMRALKMAMSPKMDLLIRFEIVTKVDICLTPVSAVMDNGKDLHSGDIARLLADLNVVQRFAGAYKGEQKPFIERFFRTLKAFLRKIRGSQGKGLPTRGPKRRDIEEPTPLTLDQAERIIWKWLYDTYHIRPHAGLQNKSPVTTVLQGIQRLEAQRAKGYPAPLRPFAQYSSIEIDAMFSIRKTLNVDARGVRFMNLFWNSGALRELGLKSVQARINPDDLGSILVYSPKAHGFIRVPNTQPTYALGLSLPVHKRVCARIREHERRKYGKDRGLRIPDLPAYLKNECSLLHEVFDMVGLPKLPQRRLRDGAAVLGQHLDMAVAVARADALDIAAGRTPPHWDDLIDLELSEDGTYTMEPREIPAAVKRKKHDYPAEPEFSEEDDPVDVHADPTPNLQEIIQ